MIISLGIILRIKIVSDKICREIKSKVPRSIIFFFFENRHDVYEVMLKTYGTEVQAIYNIWYDQTGYTWQYKAKQEICKQIDTRVI
jgi:hypothetical protein